MQTNLITCLDCQRRKFYYEYRRSKNIVYSLQNDTSYIKVWMTIAVNRALNCIVMQLSFKQELLENIRITGCLFLKGTKKTVTKIFFKNECFFHNFWKDTKFQWQVEQKHQWLYYKDNDSCRTFSTISSSSVYVSFCSKVLCEKFQCHTHLGIKVVEANSSCLNWTIHVSNDMFKQLNSAEIAIKFSKIKIFPKQAVYCCFFILFWKWNAFFLFLRRKFAFCLQCVHADF